MGDPKIGEKDGKVLFTLGNKTTVRKKLNLDAETKGIVDFLPIFKHNITLMNSLTLS